jgi:hypothetical protein
MKPNLPRSWLTLPEREKKIIYKMLEDKYNEAVDHEEAELQKKVVTACLHCSASAEGPIWKDALYGISERVQADIQEMRKVQFRQGN